MSNNSSAFDWPGFLPEFTKAANAEGFLGKTLLSTGAGPITAWQRAGEGPCVYISAGIHGDEPAGPLALLRLVAERLLPKEYELVICPALNPTGLAASTRANHQGLDLNRDYLQRQSSEIRAHAEWLSSRRIPDLFLSLHEDIGTPGFYLYEINCKTDAPHIASGIIGEVSPIFPPENGALIDNHVPRAPGWIFHPPVADIPDGWPEAIYLANLGCPLSFTFETPGEAELSQRVLALCTAVRSALTLCK